MAQPHETVALGVVALEAALHDAFVAAGQGSDEAALIASALLDAELCGVPTHGMLRVAGYLNGLRSGRYNAQPDVRVIHRGEASVLIDADNALGYRPAWMAMEEATTIASWFGVGVAGVRNSNEFGRAAFYVEAAAKRGFVAVVCANTLPLLGGPGATVATHGNNPLAFSAPGESAPLFDASWTPRSGGELARRRLLGLPLDPEWGYTDSAGNPTTDPAAAQQGVMPPAGGAKGFGIAILADLLAGALTGAASGPAVPRDNSNVGAFVLALDPNLFGERAGLGPALSAARSAVNASGARWPGDRSRETRDGNLVRRTVEVPQPIFETMRAAVEAASPAAAALLADAVAPSR
ncbi:MAG: Ldh family oxidoreductase [Dehalococcoidia bacterium]|nr:Ldh family oxidoreductase [Dehalococcoidia bacterium]